jgi:hypothetical protein
MAVAALAPAAKAAPVVVLGSHGASWVAQDRWLPAAGDPPVPRVASPARARPRPRVSVASTLALMVHRHQLRLDAARGYLGQLRSAQGAQRHLRGTRAAELGAVIANLNAITQAHELTPSRLPALFLTLRSNQRWWTTGPLLASGQRVELQGSGIVWEYYAGQGIELQQLGSFGKANGLYAAGRAERPAFLSLLAELIPLGAERAGGVAWEYYFSFEGSAPLWASAMAQGTAIESLTRAFRATGRRSYLALAHRALALLRAAPPEGAAVRTRLGRRYLLYTFAPGEAVINGFLQTLIGLYDYAAASRDATARALFAEGDAEARAEVPHYDTGAWSLYQPGEESTLDYHQLVTGFLQSLCSRNAAPAYCTTAARFTRYLHTAPVLRLLTARLPAGGGTVRFRLSKTSHVGIVVTRGAATTFLTSGDFGYGVGAFSLPSLPGPGDYGIRLAATDPAGNFHRITGTLTVTR